MGPFTSLGVLPSLDHSCSQAGVRIVWERTWKGTPGTSLKESTTDGTLQAAPLRQQTTPSTNRSGATQQAMPLPDPPSVGPVGLLSQVSAPLLSPHPPVPWRSRSWGALFLPGHSRQTQFQAAGSCARAGIGTGSEEGGCHREKIVSGCWPTGSSTCLSQGRD